MQAMYFPTNVPISFIVKFNNNSQAQLERRFPAIILIKGGIIESL